MNSKINYKTVSEMSKSLVTNSIVNNNMTSKSIIVSGKVNDNSHNEKIMVKKSVEGLKSNIKSDIKSGIKSDLSDLNNLSNDLNSNLKDERDEKHVTENNENSKKTHEGSEGSGNNSKGQESNENNGNNENNTQLKPRIKVIGVGGAGGNAVNNLIAHFPNNLDDFIVCNTDAQALRNSNARIKIQLGPKCTKGLGAGANPEVGAAAAQESIDEIMECVSGADMVFITAGIGGGTGTGAAPEIAQALKNMGALVVGIVTKPFLFEGSDRMRVAELGIERMKGATDTNLVISNQNLFRIADQNTSMLDAFQMADDVLCSGVRTFIDLITKHGLINLDFADVSTAMRQMVGSAVMGTGEAGGENRAIEAAEIAIACPLLNDTSIKGAKCILINISGGSDLKLFEIDAAVNFITSISGDAKVIFGTVFDDELENKIRVSFVATGIVDENDRSKKYGRDGREIRDGRDKGNIVGAGNSNGFGNFNGFSGSSSNKSGGGVNSGNASSSGDFSYDMSNDDDGIKVAMEEENPFELKFDHSGSENENNGDNNGNSRNNKSGVRSYDEDTGNNGGKSSGAVNSKKKLSFFDRLMGKKQPEKSKKDEDSVPNFLKDD